MDKKRIFTAINLPKGVKSDLRGHQKNWSSLPVRWTPESNLHITLVFIGSVSQGKIENIARVCEAVGGKFCPFRLELKEIVLGPPGLSPRMFWVLAEKHPELIKLQKVLEKAMAKKPETGYKSQQKRNYLPHITLGRINQKEWKKLSKKPEIDQELDLSFHAESVELMESALKPTGAEYKPIRSFPLEGRIKV